MMRTLMVLVALVSQAAFADPQSGLWWSPSESGRGYTIDVQGEKFNLVTYAYDNAGRMQWYYTAGSTQNNGKRISGPLIKFNGGQPLNGPYTGVPTPSGDDGIITIDFATHDKGLVTFPGGRQVAIQRQNFGVGDPPQSLLGDWIYVYSIGSRSNTFADRYYFDTIGPATPTGNGVVMDLEQYAAAEYQISGSAAGYVIAGQFTPDGTVLNAYLFNQAIEEGRGAWISPSTSTAYGMNAYRVVSPGGTGKRASITAPTAGDLQLKEGGRSSTVTAVTLEKFSAGDAEMRAVATELWKALERKKAGAIASK